MNNKVIFSTFLCGLLSASGVIFGMDRNLSGQVSDPSPDNSPRSKQNNSAPHAVTFYVQAMNLCYRLEKNGKEMRLNSNPIKQERIGNFSLTCYNTSNHCIIEQKSNIPKVFAIETVTNEQINALRDYLQNNSNVYAHVQNDIIRITEIDGHKVSFSNDSNIKKQEESKKESQKSFFSSEHKAFAKSAIGLVILYIILKKFDFIPALFDKILFMPHTLFNKMIP